MSTRNPTHGTKVHDPKAPQIVENAGAVAADSLAADSTRAGGGFGENRGSEPLGVAGANSTFANTNISGADTLEPAANSQSRKADTEDSNESYSPINGARSEPRVISDTNDATDTNEQSKSTATNNTTNSDGVGSFTSHAGVAPTYVNSQYVDTHGPKGKDIKEGGFNEGDDKNSSFTSDIGDENDPGRLAEMKFAKDNAETGANAAPKQGAGGEGLYDNLEDTSA